MTRDAADRRAGRCSEIVTLKLVASGFEASFEEHGRGVLVFGDGQRYRCDVPVSS